MPTVTAPAPPPPPDPDAALHLLRPDLLRLARHLTGAEDRAQDLVQETLLKIWQRNRAETIDDPRAYARAALRNLFRQSLRRAPFLPLEDGMEPCTDPEVDARMALHELTRAVARLPHDQAHLIRLVASGETSPRLLAARLNCPPGTVMSRLARARAQLRSDLGVGPDAPVRSLF